MQKQNKKFKFFDIFDNQEKYFCFVDITVEEKSSGGQIIYDITYNYEFSEGELSERAHPFFYSKNKNDSPEDLDGVIVVKNSLTEKMIEYLLMSEEELTPLIGNTWWIQYKIKIMQTLANFWD